MHLEVDGGGAGGDQISAALLHPADDGGDGGQGTVVGRRQGCGDGELAGEGQGAGNGDGGGTADDHVTDGVPGGLWSGCREVE